MEKGQARRDKAMACLPKKSPNLRSLGYILMFVSTFYRPLRVAENGFSKKELTFHYAPLGPK